MKLLPHHLLLRYEEIKRGRVSLSNTYDDDYHPMRGFEASTAASFHTQAYQPQIPYNRMQRFTFIGMDDVLCYHLMRFTPQEINRFLPLLDLHETRFRNRLEATPEEALAVVLIRLSYPTRYCHSRTWLCIVFHDTIILLYRRYRKMLAWDNRRLNFERLLAYSQAIHNLGGGSSFWGFIDGT